MKKMYPVKKMYPEMVQDGLTSANLQAGLSRALPINEMGQRGLTSANLQTALATPPAPRPVPAPTSSSGTASGNATGGK
jgi:hypothetical protein